MKFNFENIRNYERPYIIAEIGANHNGSINLAKKMIDAAKECGADCVKFQSWSKESIFSQRVYEDNYFLNDDYRNRNDYTLEEVVEKYSIGKNEHTELKKYCEFIGIDFTSTAFSREEVDFLVDDLDVPFIKVASMDLDNYPFLEYIARKDKPVIISSGLNDLQTICEAIECFERNSNKKLVVLHCVSIYPPLDEDVNLNNIDMLRDNFGYPTGYSDHSLGIVAPIVAISKGACVIEKHFTLDKNMEGWDHKISADPTELKLIVEGTVQAQKMLGKYRRNIVEDSKRRNAFKRSIVAKKNILKGDIIKFEDLDFKRPGTGLPPKAIEYVIGKEAKRDIKFDELIQINDF